MSVTIQNGGNSIKISTQGPAGPRGAQGEQGIQGIQGEPGPAGSNEWGTITGLLSNQTDLNTVLGELETASDTNESNLNTHIADTDIHFSDAPSDGSQYARQDGGWSVVAGGGGASDGDDTDITGLLYGDGSTLASATAAQIRAAADLDTTDSPTFDSLTLTGDISLASSNVLSVNGAGRVQLDDASGAVVEFSRAYFSGFHGGIRLGATAGDISTDVQIARNSDSEIRFVQSDGTTRCDLLADNVTLDGDISLSDGASITSAGSLTLGADSNELLIQQGFAAYIQEVDFSANNTSNGVVSLKCAGNEFLSFYGGGGWGTQTLRVNAAGGLRVNGTRKALSLSTDLYLTRDSAGVLQLGSTYQGTDGTLKLADIIASGNIDFSGLSTSDPAVAGRLWNDSGTLKVSAG